MACSITCRVCGKKFSTRANTVRHMKTYHTTFRAFACPYCNRSFKHKCHLKDHLEKCRSAQKWKKNSVVDILKVLLRCYLLNKLPMVPRFKKLLQLMMKQEMQCIIILSYIKKQKSPFLFYFLQSDTGIRTCC